MFERFTEAARRSIFFARHEASNLASGYIEAEHLLLALLREDQLLQSVLPPGSSDKIRQQVESAIAPTTKRIPTNIDLPLSHEAKRILACAAEEAEVLGHSKVDHGHLVLGMLRVKECLGAAILREKGLTLERYRDLVRQNSPQAQPAADQASASEAPQCQPDVTAVQAVAPALQPAVTTLKNLISAATTEFREWPEDQIRQNIKRKRWSRREALGHLVDWAAAHQQWFARALTEPTLSAAGDPADEWVKAQRYKEYAWRELVDLWSSLNRFLIHVIAGIPEQKLAMPCRIGIGDPVSLAALVSRYVDHCSDVLAQILTHG